MDASKRALLRAAFVGAHGFKGEDLRPLAGDASFRRYFRLASDGSAILMDAPPGLEDVTPFLAIARYLKSKGYSAPGVLAAESAKGFVLLEDLGDDTYTRLLNASEGPPEEALYEAAVDLLADLHRQPLAPEIPYLNGAPYAVPPYDEALLLREASLFTDWYYEAALGAPCPDAERRTFLDAWLDAFPAHQTASPVLVLRDYHADNLMWLPGRAGLARVGLLDFQDAVIGHPAYDLVSLLEDARRDVPVPLANRMLGRYVEAMAKGEEAEFRAAFATLGAQRNTKIIGIFTRLWKRDRKPNYLKLIPRVWGLLERDLEHPRLARVRAWFDRVCPPSLRRAVLEPL